MTPNDLHRCVILSLCMWVEPVDLMRYHSHDSVPLHGRREISLGKGKAFSLAGCRRGSQTDVLWPVWKKANVHIMNHRWGSLWQRAVGSCWVWSLANSWMENEDVSPTAARRRILLKSELGSWRWAQTRTATLTKPQFQTCEESTQLYHDGLWT